MFDALNELVRGLQFRYGDAPREAQVSIHQYTEETGFSTRLYRVRELQEIASHYQGSEIDTWARISLLPAQMSLQPGSRGLERDTWGTCTLHVDLDPDGSDNWKEEKLADLAAFWPPPSRVESSGRGLYALWKIPFTEDWQRVKRINKWLAQQLGGDSCWDTARVLRLPGTQNPRTNTLARVLKEAAYNHHFDDFREADLTSQEEALEEFALQPEPLPLDFEVRCRRDRPRLWGRIFTEQTARDALAGTKADGSIDRSNNDYSIALSLLHMGLSPGQVMTVLTHPTWFSGEKWREGYKDSYVTYTIKQAYDLVPEAPMVRFYDVAQKLLEEHNLLQYTGLWYRYSEKGVYEEAPTFIPLATQTLMLDKWAPEKENAVIKYLYPHAFRAELPSLSGLINCRSGMLDPRVGTLRKHSPGDFSLTQVNADWDPNVDTQEVDAFVRDILPEEEIPTWWQFCGYCLHTDTPLPYRAILALKGPKRTGKSTLLNALREFVGAENCSALALTDLAGEVDRFTTSSLVGKMLNIDSDAPYEANIGRIHLLKKLASGDPIKIERKNERAYDQVLPVKLAFAMNGYPSIGQTDAAFYDRWLVIAVRSDRTFTRENPATKINAHMALLSQMKNRNAWLLQFVRGLQVLHEQRGFKATASMERSVDEMRRINDTAYQFWCACSVPDEGALPRALITVYESYRQWMAENGLLAVSSRKFIDATKALNEDKLLEGLWLSLTDRWYFKGRKITFGMHLRNSDSVHVGT